MLALLGFPLRLLALQQLLALAFLLPLHLLLHALALFLLTCRLVAVLLLLRTFAFRLLLALHQCALFLLGLVAGGRSRLLQSFRSLGLFALQ